jgi:gluconate 2-dehydrogenase gamma chain
VLFSGQPPRWRFLTDAEASLLDAMCAQIIPTDQDPGAREAGCVTFIDRQLVGPHQRFADRYRAGLTSLVATCQTLHKKTFEELSSAEQIKLLEKLERGQVPKDATKASGRGGRAQNES